MKLNKAVDENKIGFKLNDEEVVVLSGYPKKRKDGSITIKALINIYTSEGVYRTIITTNCKKELLTNN